MVIRASDRVSAVLARDEKLVDVFVSVSPAFERLRNPRMRKVMARLVTVEQAARMGGVDCDTLVARLNEAIGATSATHSSPPAAAAAASGASRKPSALDAIAPADIITADVRDQLRAGIEPFSSIMAARRQVPPGGALCVRALFEPVPLYAVLRQQGFTHWTERRADDDWLVWFYAAPDDAADAHTIAQRAHGDVVDESAPDVLVLDVRGLEPPEPMMRTLAALEQLPEGGTLVQLNVRVPQFLLPMLEERGFTYETRQQEPGLVRVFIRRKPATVTTE